MNNALDYVKEAYKPIRLTKKGNITIFEGTSGSFVLKDASDSHLRDSFSYLMARNFDYFPALIDDKQRGANIFSYIKEIPMPKEQKALDMIELVALLHNKTTFYKEVTEDKYKEIYDNINNNLLYTRNYYDKMYENLEREIYHSPSHYLLVRNIYKIYEALDFLDREALNWFYKVKDETKTRLAFIHNNLETDHYLRSDKGYLISWEKSRIDAPILDLINFYQKEYMEIDFEPILKRYLKSYPLHDEEMKLFLIVISIPPIINLGGKEMDDVRIIREKLDYIFKTEALVKEFFTNDEDK